jgi:hypothetical protein
MRDVKLNDNVMTLPSITNSLQHKLKHASHSPDYAKVIQFLNEIQDEKSRKRFKRGTARITILLILILAAISIAVIVVMQ